MFIGLLVSFTGRQIWGCNYKDLMPWSLVKRYHCFREMCCLHLQGRQIFFCPEDKDGLGENITLIMDTTSSKLLTYIYDTTVSHARKKKSVLKNSFLRVPKTLSTEAKSFLLQTFQLHNTVSYNYNTPFICKILLYSTNASASTSVCFG